MRRCNSQFPNPTSQIARPGRLFQMFAMFPMFPMFSMFPMFAMFAMFSRTRDARKKTERREMRNADAEARASARAYHPKRHSQAGIWSSNSRLKPELRTFYHPVRRSGVHPSLSRRGAFGIRDPRKPRLKSRSRFTCFKCFRHFTSFIRFKRFRNVWPRRKMKQSRSEYGRSRPIRTRHSAASLSRNCLIFRTNGGFRV